MKKLITLIVMANMLFGAGAYAQDHKKKGGDRTPFRVLRLLKNNADFKEQLAAHKESRIKFQKSIKDLKASFDKAKLEGASTPQLDEIKGNIRSLLKGHRKEQRVFQKMVRKKIRALRKDRLKKRGKKPTKGT